MSNKEWGEVTKRVLHGSTPVVFLIHINDNCDRWCSYVSLFADCVKLGDGRLEWLRIVVKIFRLWIESEVGNGISYRGMSCTRKKWK